MANEKTNVSLAELATQRLNELLTDLLAQGLTQTQIAARAAIPPQYLSDIKRGERPLTELVARRLGEEFDCDYAWLLGASDTMEKPTPRSRMGAAGNVVSLPMFPFPIAGDPRQHAAWKGTWIEVAGAAARRIDSATHPYVLEFERDDVLGRLRPGDLVLMSQSPNPDAEIHVVCYRKKYFLARAGEAGGWRRVADGNELPDDCPSVGHCLGIVWAALV